MRKRTTQETKQAIADNRWAPQVMPSLPEVIARIAELDRRKSSEINDK